MVLEETDTLRSFFAALPWPVWSLRKDGTLVYANAAYAQATGAGDAADAVARNVELLEAADREDFSVALHRDKAHHARLPVVVGGNRRIYDVSAVAAFAGSAAIAVDVSEAANLRAELVQMAETHRRMLNQLSSGVCVFDGQQRLAFYNAAYRACSASTAAFLDSPARRDRRARPAARRAQAARAGRFPRLEDASCSRPIARSSRASTGGTCPTAGRCAWSPTPNPEGGVTYLFDDVTERLDLERRYNALIRVQGETLDNLAEGVAVFGSDGRAAAVQPGLRAAVEAAAGRARRAAAYRRPSSTGAGRCSTTTSIWARFAAAVTGLEQPRGDARRSCDAATAACSTAPPCRCPTARPW